MEDTNMVRFVKNKVTKEVRMINSTDEIMDDEIELKANSTDAATEKHLPVIDVNGDEVTVTVSTVKHPMTIEHHIEFIALITDKKESLTRLDPEKDAIATFKLENEEKVIESYEFCNLHGLWVTKA